MNRFLKIVVATIFVQVLLVQTVLCAEQAAGTPVSKEAIAATLKQDLETAFTPSPLIQRLCTNGEAAPTTGAIEYWVDFECGYCQPIPVTKDCIVVRHMPSSDSSIEKSLIYESLLNIAPEQAQNFWKAVAPHNDSPVTSRAQLRVILQSLLAMQKMDEEQFTKQLPGATNVVQADQVAGLATLSSTPTWIIDGIRFSACDFNQYEFAKVRELAQKAKNHDAKAFEELVDIIFSENNGG